jgi:hypothetical protein
LQYSFLDIILFIAHHIEGNLALIDALMVFSLEYTLHRIHQDHTLHIISEATKHQISAREYPIPFRACQIPDCYF